MMMIDVQCKCGKKIGWTGKFVDCPPCPRCGYRPPGEELAKADTQMEEDRRLLLANPLHASGQILRNQRVAAGLGLRQAAKLLDVYPLYLSEVEQGRQKLPTELAEKMADLYQVGPEKG